MSGFKKSKAAIPYVRTRIVKGVLVTATRTALRATGMQRKTKPTPTEFKSKFGLGAKRHRARRRAAGGAL